jgi:peptidoglycan/xylan/chitin deacetylase (PgdA/CDA1 family)
VIWLLLIPLAVLTAYGLLMWPRSQIFGAYPFRGNATDKVVALTFDDGPNEPYTSQILDHLDRRRIRATFFQVGRCVQRHPEVTREIAARGHVIGNHSLSHRFGTYFRPRAFDREVGRTQEILRDHVGRTPALARTPWLWRQPLLLRSLRRRSLAPVAGVFCHPLEVLQISGERIGRAAAAKARPGSILIFHDGFDGHGGDRGETVRAVAVAIDALVARGFRFVTVDELLRVPAYLD